MTSDSSVGPVVAVARDGVDLAAIAALAEAATPGPWTVKVEAGPPISAPSGVQDAWCQVSVEMGDAYAGLLMGEYEGEQADAEFIAAARTAVPALVAALAEARAETAQREQMHDVAVAARDEATDRRLQSDYALGRERRNVKIAEAQARVARAALAEARRTLADVRAYVDNPGNWSALDVRRGHLLWRLDGARSGAESAGEQRG
jgi:hypothetical protein